jgi:hypothetical protein
MKKTYQPIVIEKSEEIVKSLIESYFFEDYELSTTDFAKTYFCDNLTDKFITGELDFNDDNLFTEEEFEKCLREIVAGTILLEMKEKGLVESYEDDNTEELFFLTDKGKELLAQQEKNDLDTN